MAKSLEFKIPGDLSPMPTMGSDDEDSFVVLCNSVTPHVDISLTNLHIEPVQSGPIEEGKELITMELSRTITSVLPQMPYMAQRINDSEPTISVTNISSDLSPEEVQRKVDTVINENIKLRDTIIANNAAMELQHGRIKAWKEEVQKTHQAHILKFAAAKEFISRLKSEKNLLTFELDKSNEIRVMQQAELLKLKADLAGKESLTKSSDTTDSATVENIALINTQKELNDAKIKITELERVLMIINLAKDKVAAENKELKSRNLSLADNEKIIDKLNIDILERNRIIEELKDNLKNREESYANTIENLNSEIINMKSQLCQSIDLQNDLDKLQMHYSSSSRCNNVLRETNYDLNEQIKALEEEVKELKKLESIKDEYFALQQQLEIYKADFLVERESKIALKAENEQIMSDFRQIQKRNNELNEELELVKERGFEVITRRENPNSSSSSNTSTLSSQERRYTCPICNFGFTNYQALENHIERCMDLSASLP